MAEQRTLFIAVVLVSCVSALRATIVVCEEETVNKTAPTSKTGIAHASFCVEVNPPPHQHAEIPGKKDAKHCSAHHLCAGRYFWWWEPADPEEDIYTIHVQIRDVRTNGGGEFLITIFTNRYSEALNLTVIVPDPGKEDSSPQESPPVAHTKPPVAECAAADEVKMCPNGWVPVDTRYCLMEEVGPPLNFPSAQDSCADFGATLVTLKKDIDDEAGRKRRAVTQHGIDMEDEDEGLEDEDPQDDADLIGDEILRHEGGSEDEGGLKEDAGLESDEGLTGQGGVEDDEDYDEDEDGEDYDDDDGDDDGDGEDEDYDEEEAEESGTESERGDGAAEHGAQEQRTEQENKTQGQTDGAGEDEEDDAFGDEEYEDGGDDDEDYDDEETDERDNETERGHRELEHRTPEQENQTQGQTGDEDVEDEDEEYGDEFLEDREKGSPVKDAESKQEFEVSERRPTAEDRDKNGDEDKEDDEETDGDESDSSEKTRDDEKEETAQPVQEGVGNLELYDHYAINSCLNARLQAMAGSQKLWVASAEEEENFSCLAYNSVTRDLGEETSCHFLYNRYACMLDTEKYKKPIITEFKVSFHFSDTNHENVSFSVDKGRTTHREISEDIESITISCKAEGWPIPDVVIVAEHSSTWGRSLHASPYDYNITDVGDSFVGKFSCAAGNILGDEDKINNLVLWRPLKKSRTRMLVSGVLLLFIFFIMVAMCIVVNRVKKLQQWRACKVFIFPWNCFLFQRRRPPGATRLTRDIFPPSADYVYGDVWADEVPLYVRQARERKSSATGKIYKPVTEQEH